jgi:hypothetical protein
VNDNQLTGSLPLELMNLTALLDDTGVDLCNNTVYTENAALRDFLDTKQIGGDWESCQAFPVPIFSERGMIVLLVLLAGSALWVVRRAEA